jgi:hypothetical protein
MQSLLPRSRCSVDHTAELVDGELEPQLVRLMDDDEQQFVIESVIERCADNSLSISRYDE